MSPRGPLGALALLGALASPALAGKAFVLLGATGDNAYRPAGFWTGLFEAWCNGVFETTGTELHVQINQGHTEKEIHDKVMGTLSPFYETLQEDKSWKCLAEGGDCTPEAFFSIAKLNIWEGMGRYNSSGQAANMSYLAKYDQVIAYMNLPPSAYQEWAEAMVKYWGGGEKVEIAVEKPFGGGRDSLQNAKDLHANITASGLSEGNLHLTDHWLSFFMNKHLPEFRSIVESKLGIEWSSKDIERIVITEYEERGFGGRGSFIDGLGQVRDMVQSHLLQVLALTTMDREAAARSLSDAKLSVLKDLSLVGCELRQFDGLLESHYLKYHATYADSTWCRVHVQSANDLWRDVDMVIQTGKAMDVELYTIEVFQRGGPGVLTFDIGKEEVGLGDIKVANWTLKESSPFTVPLPGFNSKATTTMTPEVSAAGDGYILRYNNPDWYFPKPYGTIVNALLTGNYAGAFVTFPECQRGWEIVTGTSPSVCLDPAPGDVEVYLPAFLCDKTAPDMCDQHKTVADQYDVTFSCTPQHDKWYADIDFYKAKCHPSSQVIFL